MAVAMPVLLTAAAFAQDEVPNAAAEAPGAEVLIWTLMAAFLVFFMQAGFALVEAGFVRAKNVCNIIMKNVMDFSMGSIAFFLIGFGIMFGTSAGGWFGTSLFGVSQAPEGVDQMWLYCFFVFQVVFAATAATIVSGAMAERTKFTGYLIYSVFICVLVYPIFGKWAWGSLLFDGGAGWLEGKGFLDFAGSTVVHSVGGWTALAGAIVLGPRIGKFTAEGKPMAILGHSMPMAALGTFILFFGWFGFNAGSSTDGSDSTIALISMNTLLSGAAGAVGAMIATWIIFKKPETGLTLNGILAGLVAITAGCDVMYPAMSIITGLIAGVLVVGSVLFIEKVLKIDDPVGAVSVHGMCGVWGTLALGIPGFSSAGGIGQLGIQALGVVAAMLWVLPTTFTLFFVLKKIGMLRVSAEEEIGGLDIIEHGNEGYPKSSWEPGFGGGSPLPGTSSSAFATSPAAMHIKAET
jgi:Amt family ammonium transporter